MSAAGCVDRLDLHGESYQVQTELVDPGAGRVRTLIFHAGRIVATSEAVLAEAATLFYDPDGVRAVVARHHQQVVDGFVGRTRTFFDRLHSAQQGVEEVHAAPAAPAAGPPQPALELEAEMPPFPEDPAVGDGLELRRLFGELRLRIEGRAEGQPAHPPGDQGGDRGTAICLRLERVRDALDWALAHPSFGRARIDEQARFNVISGRVDAWAEHGSNPDEAEWIWTEVVVFCDYVSEISHRAELVEFDRRLVRWGLRALDRHGPTRSTLKPLGWLFGRDRDLDDALAAPHALPAEAWAAHLRRVWHRLGSA